MSLEEILDEIENEDRERVLSTGATTIFLVTYHPPSLPLLIPMFQELMECMSGYVTCDSWHTTYSLKEIQSLVCG